MLKTLIWMIVDSTYIYRNYRHNRNVVRKLTKAFWRPLLVESRRQPERDAEEIGACTKPTLVNQNLRGGLYCDQVVVLPCILKGSHPLLGGQGKGHGGLSRTMPVGGPDPPQVCQ